MSNVTSMIMTIVSVDIAMPVLLTIQLVWLRRKFDNVRREIAMTSDVAVRCSAS